MKVCVRGYKPLVIPDAAVATEKGAFNATTPYVAKLTTRLTKRGYLANKLPAKLLCLEALKRRMLELGGYSSFAEPLAGVGLSTRIFDMGGKLYLNDFDAGCRKVLAANFKGKIGGEDVLSMKIPKTDVVFLDFNDFTFKRYIKGPYGVVLSRAFASAKNFVILNDCSVFYFRYGKKSYATYSKYVGSKVTCPEDYFVALGAHISRRYPGWGLSYVAYFRDTAFLLFARDRAEAIVEYISSPEPIVTVEGI